MKVSITKGDVTVEVSDVECSTQDDVRGVAGLARELVNQLMDPPQPQPSLLPFGFSVWADTERVAEEVLGDADAINEPG